MAPILAWHRVAPSDRLADFEAGRPNGGETAQIQEHGEPGRWQESSACAAAGLFSYVSKSSGKRLTL